MAEVQVGELVLYVHPTRGVLSLTVEHVLGDGLVDGLIPHGPEVPRNERDNANRVSAIRYDAGKSKGTWHTLADAEATQVAVAPAAPIDLFKKPTAPAPFIPAAPAAPAAPDAISQSEGDAQ